MTSKLNLSQSQYQVWLDQQSRPDSIHLNVGGTGIIHGPLNIAQMNTALTHMVKISEAFRLLPQTDGSQLILDQWPESELLEFHDFSAEANPKSTMENWWQAAFLAPFILDGKQRPWRIALIQTSNEHFGVFIKCHHIIMDGYSTGLAFRRWSAIYNAMEAGLPSEVNEQRHYHQYIDESNAYLKLTAYQKDAQFWHDTLPSLPSPMMSQHHEDDTKLPHAHHHHFHIPPPEYLQIQQYAQAQKVTPYHLFIAALAIYFCRINNKTELVLGVPVLNRSGKKYKQTLGMFVMVLPLRMNIDKCTSVDVLLADISRNLRAIYRHARYPLSTIGQDLDMIKHGQDRLFDIILSYEQQDFTVHFGAADLFEARQLFGNLARFPLAVSVCEFHDNEPIEVVYEASAEHFSQQGTEQLGQRLHYLMMQMVSHEDHHIHSLPLLLEQERYRLIVGKHADIAQHPNPQPFICAFEHHAALHPEAIAIHTEQQQISYGQFNTQANRLARQLVVLGVKKNDLVAVVMPRQFETLIAFFAIAKAGAAFVPIDPLAPTQRINKLLQTCGAALTLVSKTSPTLESHQTLVIDVDNAPQYDNSLSSDNVKITPNADDLAYVLFTSGSTGTPKGVLMNHGPLARRMAWLVTTFNYIAGDVALQSVQLTFDPSLIEIILPLTHGGSVALAPPGQIAPADIAHYAQQFGATHIALVPATLRYLAQTADQYPDLKLRIAVCGGEVLHRQLASQFVNKTGAQLYNLYGPTEACIFATAYYFDKNKSTELVPIGKPVDDTRIYILDANLQPLPWGVVGEIFIGGNTLACGYLNNAQTNKSFINDPFVEGARLYRSGDNGYWDPNGELQFVGRIDNQIKVRGQRIEPAEIEAALCELDFVSSAAVKKLSDELHGWVVAQHASKQTLRKALLDKLPTHMVPTGFTVLDEMPLHPSGKINYRALVVVKSPSPSKTKLVAPRTGLERLLLNLFEDAQLNQPLDIHSDFFESGGNSLAALNLLSEMKNEIGQRLPLSVMLHHPTVATLASAVIQSHQPLLVNLSDDNTGAVLYLAASGHGDALRFEPLVKALGADFCVKMLQPPIHGQYSTSELAEYYASEIEQHHHGVPPLLAGFSVGGIAALETARRLVSRNVPFNKLVLIDTVCPVWIFRKTPLWFVLRWLVRRLRLHQLNINQRTLGSLFEDAGLNGQIKALGKYQLNPYALPVTLVVSSGFNRWHRVLFRPWRKLFKHQLSEHKLEGFHGTLFAPEHVEGLARVIRLSVAGDR